VDQKIEHLRFDRHRRAAATKLPALNVELMIAEREGHR
jgi:hypothetical protein